MTWYSSKDVAYVLIDNYSVGGFLNSARIKVGTVLVDTTGLGDTWREMTDTGLRNGEFEGSGFYSGEYDARVMNTVSGTDRVVSVMLEGNTVSKRFYGFQKAIVSAAEVGISSDSVHTSTPTITVRGRVDLGYVVAPYATRTTGANTDLTYADFTAGSTGGMAYLHISPLTLGGYDNLIVTVRDSADHITFADHTAFAAATVLGGQAVALGGAIERYASVSWAWTGSGTGQSAAFFVGVGLD